jgi:hypothetical protein
MVDPRIKSADVCLTDWLRSSDKEVKPWEICTLRVAKTVVNVSDGGGAPSLDEVQNVASLSFRDVPIEQVLKSHITHRENKSKWADDADVYSRCVPWLLGTQKKRNILKNLSIQLENKTRMYVQ